MGVIEAVGLGKRYGRKWGLRDCALSVPAGCVTGLVGPNGSGKTALLSLAVGLIRLTEGGWLLAASLLLLLLAAAVLLIRRRPA
jgi:ABC-type multidrug transport system ATPase subunit